LKFTFLDSVDSTNLEALRRVDQGESVPFWILAKSQTQGRGSRGRDWVSKAGNLFCTGGYPAFKTPQETSKLSFVACLAIADTLEAYVPSDLITVKWPNDVLLAGKKVSGVLLENNKNIVLVGIGINLVSHPDKTNYPATHLLAHIEPKRLDGPERIMTGPDAVLAMLAQRFTHWYEVLAKQGFAPIRQSWLSRTQNFIGSIVNVHLSQEALKGEVVDLGQNGELQLRLDNGTIRDIHTGDVFPAL